MKWAPEVIGRTTSAYAALERHMLKGRSLGRNAAKRVISNELLHVSQPSSFINKPA